MTKIKGIYAEDVECKACGERDYIYVDITLTGETVTAVKVECLCCGNNEVAKFNVLTDEEIDLE